MKEFERKPDGGLSAWIETYEAMGAGENDAEMLCLLLELRRRRENQAEAERERDELKEQLRSVNNALELSDQYCDTDCVMDELGICYEEAELRANGAIAFRDGVSKLRFTEVQ